MNIIPIDLMDGKRAVEVVVSTYEEAQRLLSFLVEARKAVQEQQEKEEETA